MDEANSSIVAWAVDGETGEALASVVLDESADAYAVFKTLIPAPDVPVTDGRLRVVGESACTEFGRARIHMDACTCSANWPGRPDSKPAAPAVAGVPRSLYGPTGSPRSMTPRCVNPGAQCMVVAHPPLRQKTRHNERTWADDDLPNPTGSGRVRNGKRGLSVGWTHQSRRTCYRRLSAVCHCRSCSRSRTRGK